MMPNHNTRHKVFINKWGREVAIRRRGDPEEEADRLRNEKKGSYAMVGTEKCARYFDDDEATKSLETSGMRHEERPNLMFYRDADVVEGDRIYWNANTVYQIHRVTRRQHYIKATTKLVND